MKAIGIISSLIIFLFIISIPVLYDHKILMSYGTGFMLGIVQCTMAIHIVTHYYKWFISNLK